MTHRNAADLRVCGIPAFAVRVSPVAGIVRALLTINEGLGDRDTEDEVPVAAVRKLARHDFRSHQARRSRSELPMTRT
ncbi:hypothetical protein GCM10022382_26980 [Microbacterium invictum]